MTSLNTTKYIVAEVLSEDKKTRNNDTWLILQTLRKLGFKVYIDYHEINNMPSFESISRSRRYWQNTRKEFLPIEKIGINRDKGKEEYIEVFK